jgi:hypothetical protein
MIVVHLIRLSGPTNSAQATLGLNHCGFIRRCQTMSGALLVSCQFLLTISLVILVPETFPLRLDGRKTLPALGLDSPSSVLFGEIRPRQNLHAGRALLVSFLFVSHTLPAIPSHPHFCPPRNNRGERQNQKHTPKPQPIRTRPKRKRRANNVPKT